MGRVRLGGADAGDDVLERRLDLGAIGFARPELRRVQHRPQDNADVSLAGEVAPGHGIDQCRRRSVADEADCQLLRQEVRRRGIHGQHVQHGEAFLLAVAVDGLAEDNLVAGLVAAVHVKKFAAVAGIIHGPTGKDLRDLGNVVLGVAAVDAEGVELHQFARVVLIQSAAGCLGWTDAIPLAHGCALSSLRVWTDAGFVIEIVHHGGTGGYGAQQVFKLAERARTNHFAFIGSDLPWRQAGLTDIDIEVIEPEVGHHFLQLPFAVDVIEQLGFHRLAGDDAVGVSQRDGDFFLLGGKAVDQQQALGALEPRHQLAGFAGRKRQQGLKTLGWRQGQDAGFLRLQRRNFRRGKIVGSGLGRCCLSDGLHVLRRTAGRALAPGRCHR